MILFHKFKQKSIPYDKKVCFFYIFLRLIDKTLTKPEAEFEIYADAIANELFTDYKSIEVLATQNQSLFTRLKQWFYRNVIKTSEQTTVLGTKAAQRKTYALMLKAEKAAMNKASGEGIAFSAKKKYNKNTTYDEYASLVQQWSHSASTKPKDMKIFNYKGKDFRLLEATEDGDYIEIVRGNFKKVESVYAEARREIDKYRETVYESADRYEAERNGNSWNSLNDKVRGTNGQNSQQIEGDRLSSDTSGNYEYNRSSDSGKDVSYSAKPSETAQRITENFGYTETTANNIVKAARTLKQKAKLI